MKTCATLFSGGGLAFNPGFMALGRGIWYNKDNFMTSRPALLVTAGAAAITFHGGYDMGSLPQTSPNGKRCSRCGEHKSLEEFNNNRSTSDGKHPYCRVCYRAYMAALRVQKAEHYREYDRKRRAADPEKFKQRDRKRRAATPEKFRERDRLRRIKYAEERRARCRAWHAKNKERISAKRKENREALSAARADWRARNIDRDRANAKDWKLRNRSRILVYWQRKRVKRLAAPGTISRKEWTAVVEKYNYTCLCCGRSEPEIKITIDHVIPVSRGGSNTIDNVQPLCFECNLRKFTKSTDYREKVGIGDE